MKIVIACGAGLVGRNLVRVMLQNGLNDNEIVVIDSSQWVSPTSISVHCKLWSGEARTLSRSSDRSSSRHCLQIPANTSPCASTGRPPDEPVSCQFSLRSLINLAAHIWAPQYEPFHRNCFGNRKHDWSSKWKRYKEGWKLAQTTDIHRWYVSSGYFPHQ